MLNSLLKNSCMPTASSAARFLIIRLKQSYRFAKSFEPSRVSAAQLVSHQFWVKRYAHMMRKCWKALRQNRESRDF